VEEGKGREGGREGGIRGGGGRAYRNADFKTTDCGADDTSLPSPDTREEAREAREEEGEEVAMEEGGGCWREDGEEAAEEGTPGAEGRGGGREGGRARVFSFFSSPALFLSLSLL